MGIGLLETVTEIIHFKSLQGRRGAKKRERERERERVVFLRCRLQLDARHEKKKGEKHFNHLQRRTHSRRQWQPVQRRLYCNNN